MNAGSLKSIVFPPPDLCSRAGIVALSMATCQILLGLLDIVSQLAQSHVSGEQWRPSAWAF